MGCSAARTGATTTRTVPARSRSRTSSRAPTVAACGDRRSCGRVSQAGKTATASSPRNAPMSPASCSASRLRGSTTSSGAVPASSAIAYARRAAPTVTTSAEARSCARSAPRASSAPSGPRACATAPSCGGVGGASWSTAELVGMVPAILPCGCDTTTRAAAVAAGRGAGAAGWGGCAPRRTALPVRRPHRAARRMRLRRHHARPRPRPRPHPPPPPRRPRPWSRPRTADPTATAEPTDTAEPTATAEPTDTASRLQR